MSARYEFVLDCTEAPEPVGPPSGVQVRSPTADDLEALADVMLDAYRGTVDYDGEDLDDARTEVAGYLDASVGDAPLLGASRVALEDGRLVSACLVASWGLRDRPLVGYVMTRADAKRRGLGRALLTDAVSALCRAGHPDVRAVITEGNTPSERLFETVGFRRANP